MKPVVECPELLALLNDGDDDEARAGAVARHIAACPICVEAEAALAVLVAAYRRRDPAPLAPDRERRLFDFLVTLPRPGHSGS